jgi:hypothetical protein
MAVVGGFCCLKQRALGRRERAIEDAMWEKRQLEMQSYRRQVAASFGVGSHPAYEPVPQKGPMVTRTAFD